MKLNNLLSIKEFSIENKLKLHNKVGKEVINEKKKVDELEKVYESLSDDELFDRWFEDVKNSEALIDDWQNYKLEFKNTSETGDNPQTFKEWAKERFAEIKDELDLEYWEVNEPDDIYDDADIYDELDSYEFTDENKKETQDIQYKGITITKLFPSGYYEYRSRKEGRFLKFDTLRGAKESIDEETKKTKKKVNEGFNDVQELTFICDQLANSMEFYNSPEEFAEHIGSQGSMFDKETLKQMAIDYWKLSPHVRLNNDTDDWSMWVLDNYETNESIKEAKETKETKEQGVKGDEDSGNLFGVAQVIDSKIPRIGSFSSYTKMINPPTPKERPILNAGQYIENDTVAGYINRIEGNKVFVESLEKPGEIVEVSIKDAVKVKKENKENTAKQKIKEYGSLKEKKKEEEEGDWKEERFNLLSDAKTFQRKKRKEGFKTKLEKHAGIANPYSIVKWKKQ